MTNGWIRFDFVDMITWHTRPISLLSPIESMDSSIRENTRDPVHLADLSSECGNNHILANETNIMDISHSYKKLAHKNTLLKMCLRTTQKQTQKKTPDIFD